MRYDIFTRTAPMYVASRKLAKVSFGRVNEAPMPTSPWHRIGNRKNSANSASAKPTVSYQCMYDSEWNHFKESSLSIKCHSEYEAWLLHPYLAPKSRHPASLLNRTCWMEYLSLAPNSVGVTNKLTAFKLSSRSICSHATRRVCYQCTRAVGLIK